MEQPGSGEQPSPPAAEPVAAWPTAALAACTALSIVALILAAAAGGPYLDLSSLNPWVAVFAVTAFGALFAVPFAANRQLVVARPEHAERWEGAMLVWGAVAAAALLLAGLLVFPGDFSPGGSLADAAGLILLIEAGMVVGALGVWLVSG